jgi:hypothetical protein
MTGGQRRIDRILDTAYLEGLTERPLSEVRKIRAEVEEEEALLSYERRLLQARIDIIKAEKERRAGTGGSLIERLPQILADEPRPSRGSMPPLRDPPSLENPRRRVEKLVSDDTLLNIPDLSDEKIDEIVTTLQGAEQEVSEQRHAVQTILDALTGEVGRRYASGEANPADVLAQGQ